MSENDTTTAKIEDVLEEVVRVVREQDTTIYAGHESDGAMSMVLGGVSDLHLTVAFVGTLAKIAGHDLDNFESVELGKVVFEVIRETLPVIVADG